MRTFSFDFAGEPRAILADVESARLYLWDGTDITDRSGAEVADMIRLRGLFENVERAKAAVARERHRPVGGWLRAMS